jgi:DNA-binding response OmpR family regulator
LAKILVIDDDRIITELVSAYLTGCDNHLIEVAENGKDALSLLAVSTFDLVILDWMLPDISGIEVCRTFRARGGRAAILMLTSKSDRFDKAAGLDAGADDYLVKPFDQVEFQARVRALLRRPDSWTDKVIKVKDLEVHSSNHKVFKSGREIVLRPKEFALLELLARHPGQNFTADAIHQRIWDSNSKSSIETVRMHVMALRKKLGDSEHEPLITSTRGLGYTIEA